MAHAWDVNAQYVSTGHVCAHCGETLEVLEEVLLLQVVYPTKTEEGLQFYAVEDINGEYLYTPYFFHMSCWEECVDDWLDAHYEEKSPVLHPDGIAECDGCTSDILPWEISGVLTVGEFQRSERTEPGAVRFVTLGTRDFPYCMSCLTLINEHCIELWEEGINYMNACPEGIHERCWRKGYCSMPNRDCRIFTTEG